MKIKELICEGRNHPVICVDVQPQYCQTSVQDNPICWDIINFVNRQTGPVLMFVNAEQTGLTDDSVDSIKQFWHDVVCPDSGPEDTDCPGVNWARFEIVDKGFGYFRGWMDDGGIKPSVIIGVIRAMYQQRLTDSREFEDNDFAELRQLVGSEWKDWMRDEALAVNWTSVARLKRYAGAYLVGGARYECLREVELLMNAFNIPYRRIDSLIYGD